MSKEFPHASLTYSSPYTPEGMTSPAHIAGVEFPPIPERYESVPQVITAYMYLTELLSGDAGLGIDYQTRYAHSIAGDPSKRPSDRVDVVRHVRSISDVLTAVLGPYEDTLEYKVWRDVRIKGFTPARAAGEQRGWTGRDALEAVETIDRSLEEAFMAGGLI